MVSEFFGQLEEFSARVFDLWGLSRKCPWVQEWARRSPRGAILHYTKGNSIKRTVRYFMNAKFKAKASAHVVVAPTWLPELDNLAAGLPLVRDLGVTVIQCEPPDKATWHATWTNGLCYGIEQVNLGELKPGHPASNGQALRMYGRWWDPYPVEQIAAVILILRELREVYPSVRRNWILGHEQVQGTQTQGSSRKDKRDPGPHYPFEAVREAVFELPDIPLHQLPGLAHYRADRHYGRTVRDGLVLHGAESDAQASWWAFPDRLEAWLTEDSESVDLAMTALAVLGYDVSVPDEAFFIFRRMEGLPLNEDGVTSDFKVHVRNRVMDRFF